MSNQNATSIKIKEDKSKLEIDFTPGTFDLTVYEQFENEKLIKLYTT